MTECIAERKLLFSPKDGGDRKPFTVRIFEPSEVKPHEEFYSANGAVARCLVEFDGLPEQHIEEVFGADSVQALQLAVNIEPKLQHLSKRYDFFFPTGEGYFDEPA